MNTQHSSLPHDFLLFYITVMILHLVLSMLLRLLTSLHLRDGNAAQRCAPMHLCPLHLHVSSFKPEYACVFNCSVVSNSLQPQGLQPTRLLCPWESPGKNTGVGCHFLPQGIFPTHGSNLHLLHYRHIPYHGATA